MPILQHNFCFLGQLRQSVFPDLFLTTKDAGPTDLIPAHRVVLSAVSSKLHNMCKEGGKVHVRNIQYRVLEEVVRFIYTGSIEIRSDEDIENVRDGLDMLKIKIVSNEVHGDTNANEVNDEGLHNHPKVGQAQNVYDEGDSWITVSDVRSGVDIDELKTKSQLKDANQASSQVKRQAKLNVQSFTDVLESISRNETEGFDETATGPRVNREEEGLIKAVRPSCSVGKKESEADDYENVYGTQKFKKSETKVPCDYCDEYVTLHTYVSHCRKIHSIGGNDERFKKKCVKCPARVHILAKKFHDSIYHQAVAENKHNKSKPVEIVGHDKILSKIRCEFCNDTIIFKRYRSHVKMKHPEINHRENVKCGKCSKRVFKIAFKCHREIYHKSAQETSQSVPVEAPVNPRPCRKRKFPTVGVKDEILIAPVDPRPMHQEQGMQEHGHGTVDLDDTYGDGSYDYGQYGEGANDDGSGMIDPNRGMPLAGSVDGNKDAIDQAVSAQMLKNGGVWQCLTCGWEAKIKTRLYEHVEAKHVKTNGYSCPICGKFCSSLKGLKIHKFRYHSSTNERKKEDVEDISVTAIKSTDSTSKSIKEQKPILHCQFCSEIFSELPSLIEHIKSHMLNMNHMDVALQCAVKECNQRFDYNDKITISGQLVHFEAHIRSKHTKTSKISCKECGKKFFSPMGLAYHRKKHEDKSRFYCSKCEHFIHSNVYDEHVSISNCAKNDVFICEVCQKGFRAKSSLDNHKVIHTDEKNYKCTVCSKSFHQKGNLKAHTKRKHSF